MLFCTGNIASVPIVAEMGIGLGMLIWGSVQVNFMFFIKVLLKKLILTFVRSNLKVLKVFLYCLLNSTFNTPKKWNKLKAEKIEKEAKIEKEENIDNFQLKSFALIWWLYYYYLWMLIWGSLLFLQWTTYMMNQLWIHNFHRSLSAGALQALRWLRICLAHTLCPWRILCWTTSALR